MGNGKSAEERKKQILDIAEELFTSKGYDNTTTADLLEKVGIARGTLYYHFKSKEEILDALIERIVGGILRNVQELCSQKMAAPQKIISFIAGMKVDSAIGREIVDYAHRPQNALMHQKIQDAFLAAVTPIAARIIRDGIADGDFSTAYPEEAAQMLLVYSSLFFDDMNEMTESQRNQKAAGFVFNMERLLGMAEGSLSPVVGCI